VDKRTLFPFGANDPVHITEKLEELGVRLKVKGDVLLAVTQGQVPAEAAALIRKHKPELLHHLKEEEERKKEEALALLPPVEFGQGETVQMRTAWLLKMEDGSYIALTEEELARLDSRAGSAPKKAGGKKPVKPKA
jgi:hypothetical protein